MTQSTRGVVYTARALAAAPILGTAAGAQVADIAGVVQPAPLAVHTTVPAGSTFPVVLTTTPHGPAWHIASGPLTGYLVPYHHAGWSVNPTSG